MPIKDKLKARKYHKKYWQSYSIKNKIYLNETRREKRHEQGISKRYNGNGLTKREYRLLYKYNKKKAGKLTRETIQLVYENNIKKYETLTCYLCLKPIKFGDDHLEHKIPLSRGGTNQYENLAIACQKCNNKKGRKTEEEYRKEFCLNAQNQVGR